MWGGYVMTEKKATVQTKTGKPDGQKSNFGRCKELKQLSQTKE